MIVVPPLAPLTIATLAPLPAAVEVVSAAAGGAFRMAAATISRPDKAMDGRMVDLSVSGSPLNAAERDAIPRNRGAAGRPALAKSPRAAYLIAA
ncbi:MAG TPA: hypothetical protein VME41_13015 [Stellaceae bacterium]|nr:hypothetical protein [Stellaceae bacterium]